MEEAYEVIQFNFCAEGTATGCMPFGAGLASGMEPLLPWYPSWVWPVTVQAEHWMNLG